MPDTRRISCLYQFQSPWFDSAGDRTTHLPISEQVSYRSATEPVVGRNVVVVVVVVVVAPAAAVVVVTV
ncbi:hypothetical protein ElyMa_006847100 [Elysia marginata]|uniref:Uncharacterized protein n=1 Tax=Elysia marginata TaxID=1093978 RepID=A0AAV4J8X3_9GAST|nr:hypothetical protein ElyMa_006847100 [Elysia marginata]